MTMGRSATVLDIGGDSSFIRLNELPHRLHDKIKTLADDFTMRITSGKPVSLLETSC